MKLSNKWINGDCLKELAKMPNESVDMVMTSPPFLDVRVYSNDPCDFSNCETADEYYYMMDLLIKECERVLKPGGKFVIEFEDYNYTLGRDGREGKESITGRLNDIFLANNFTLHTEAIWRKYSAQRAMISNGRLYHRCLRGRDAIIAANFGFVYCYKKAGDCEFIKGGDVSLEEWREWADGIWNIPNSGISHSTPYPVELCERCIKLWSCPGDVILDPFAGCGTTNFAAIRMHRNAIGIELREDFYQTAIDKRFSTWTEADLDVDDSIEQMLERFNADLAAAKEASQANKAAKEEQKQQQAKKKDLQKEIKKLEAELKALDLKASEIKKIRKDAQLKFENENNE